MLGHDLEPGFDAPQAVRAAPDYAGHAAGSLAAQRMIFELTEERADPDMAWLRFVEIAARDGWKSAGCRAFILELAKRAGRA